MNTLFDRVSMLAKQKPEHVAVAFKKSRLTYSELYQKAIGIAEILRANGVEKGDAVCFSAISSPEMLIVYLGIMARGAVAVYLDKNSTPEAMAQIYEESGSVLMLTDKPMKEWKTGRRILPLRATCEEALAQKTPASLLQKAEWQEDEIMEMLFTSGTTGKPKGVMLSAKAVYHITKNTMTGTGITENDRILLPLPLNHSFALRVLRAVLYCGGTVVLQNGFTFARELENNLNEYECTGLAAVPASYEVLKSQMQDKLQEILRRFRYIEFGAGALSIKQRREITALLPNVKIYNTWGSSETGGAIFCDINEVAANEEKIGALGRNITGIEIGTFDDHGNQIQTNKNQPGHLALRGDMLMSGYWMQPEITETVFVDHWYVTNDLVYLDADGDIFMVGRADDIINVGGEKVSPVEVENVAIQYEDIVECACVGWEDRKGVLGQIPVLYVVVLEDYQEKDFLRFLLSRLERYKVPEKCIVMDKLPRNEMQKIDRRALRQLGENPELLQLMNPVINNILSRRSIRKFQDREIAALYLDMILKAGYHAPSGHNMQSWKFTVLTKKKDIEDLREKTKTAAKQERRVHFYGWENPQVLILVSNDKRNPDGCQDASCAAQNIMLAAASYGIGSVWLNPLMTLRQASPVKELLDHYQIPENHVVWATIALGYPISEGVRLAKNEHVIHYIE